MDHDDYGFCNDLEFSAVKIFDRRGLEAFEREVRARFDKACAAMAGRKHPAEPGFSSVRDRWGQLLKTVYAHQRNIPKYLDLTERIGITPADCEAIAAMFQVRRKPADALAWVERGLAIAKTDGFGGGASYKLGEIRRALLVKLGRGGEALDSAWAEFEAHPSRSTYEALLRYAPKAEAWHKKAMNAAERGSPDLVIELWLSAKEIDRLADRLGRASNAELESLSHYITEPAAERLAGTHAGVAAKVFRALSIRIIDAGKSKYYFEALLHLEKARNCYARAELDGQWHAVIAEIRREHSRKSGFMPGFERVLAARHEIGSCVSSIRRVSAGGAEQTDNPSGESPYPLHAARIACT
jgi:hypothetical protein